MIAANHASNVLGIVEIIVIGLAVIAICLTVLMTMTWDRPPWWRIHPTARRQLDIDRDRTRDWRIRHRWWNRKVFQDEPMPPMELLGRKQPEKRFSGNENSSSDDHAS